MRKPHASQTEAVMLATLFYEICNALAAIAITAAAILLAMGV